MGLRVYVYRDRLGDCTNGGLSSKHDVICLVNVDGPFEPQDDCPAAMLCRHEPFGKSVPPMVVIRPAIVRDGEWVEDDRWLMFGGNYAATCDSAFVERLRISQAACRTAPFPFTTVTRDK